MMEESRKQREGERESEKKEENEILYCAYVVIVLPNIVAIRS